MPLNVALRSKKRKGNGGGDGNAEAGATPNKRASSVSTVGSRGRPYRIEIPKVPFGYTVKDIKKLPELHRAVIKGKYEKVEKISESSKYKPTTTDKLGRTCLHVACACGEVHILEFLLKGRGSSHAIEVCDSEGFTALHTAVLYSKNSCATRMMSAGSNILARTHHQQTPLHIAAATGNKMLCHDLLFKEAEIDCFDMSGNTPLALAVANDQLEVVEFLVSKNADINFANINNESPLMLTAMSGNTQIARCLLSVPGINIAAVDHNKKTALDYAKANSDVFKEIQTFIANTNLPGSGMPVLGALKDQPQTDDESDNPDASMDFSFASDASQKDDDSWLTGTDDEKEDQEKTAALKRASAVFRQSLMKQEEEERKKREMKAIVTPLPPQNPLKQPKLTSSFPPSTPTSSKRSESPLTGSPLAAYCLATGQSSSSSTSSPLMLSKQGQVSGQHGVTHEDGSHSCNSVNFDSDDDDDLPVLEDEDEQLVPTSQPRPRKTSAGEGILSVVKKNRRGSSSSSSAASSPSQRPSTPSRSPKTSRAKKSSPSRRSPRLPKKSTPSPKSSPSRKYDRLVDSNNSSQPNKTSLSAKSGSPRIAGIFSFKKSRSKASSAEKKAASAQDNSSPQSSSNPSPQSSPPVDGCEAVAAGGASQPKKSPTKSSPKQKSRFFSFRRSPKKASSPRNKASKNKASSQNKVSPSQERSSPQKNVTSQNEASSESKATPPQPSLSQTSPPSQSAPVTCPAIPVVDDSDSIKSEQEDAVETAQSAPNTAAADQPVEEQSSSSPQPVVTVEEPTKIGADFDDSDSYVSTEEEDDKKEEVNDEDENMKATSQIAEPAEPVSSTQPAVPLGADFDDSVSEVATKEEEQEDEKNKDENVEEASQPAEPVPSTQPAMPLGADFVDSVSEVATKEEEEDENVKGVPQPLPVLSTRPAVPLGADFDDSDVEEIELLPSQAVTTAATEAVAELEKEEILKKEEEEEEEEKKEEEDQEEEEKEEEKEEDPLAVAPVLTKPALPLGADFDDSVSYVTSEEEVEELLDQSEEEEDEEKEEEQEEELQEAEVTPQPDAKVSTKATPTAMPFGIMPPKPVSSEIPRPTMSMFYDTDSSSASEDEGEVQMDDGITSSYVPTISQTETMNNVAEKMSKEEKIIEKDEQKEKETNELNEEKKEDDKDEEEEKEESPKSLAAVTSAIHTAVPLEKTSQVSLLTPVASADSTSSLTKSASQQTSPAVSHLPTEKSSSAQDAKKSTSPLVSKSLPLSNSQGNEAMTSSLPVRSGPIQVSTLQAMTPSFYTTAGKRRSDDSMLESLVMRNQTSAQQKIETTSEFERLMQKRRSMSEQKETQEEKEETESPQSSAAVEAIKLAKENGVQEMTAKWEKGAPFPTDDDDDNASSTADQEIKKPSSPAMSTPRPVSPLEKLFSTSIGSFPSLSTPIGEEADRVRREHLIKETRAMLFTREIPEEDEEESSMSRSNSEETCYSLEYEIELSPDALSTRITAEEARKDFEPATGPFTFSSRPRTADYYIAPTQKQSTTTKLEELHHKYVEVMESNTELEEKAYQQEIELREMQYKMDRMSEKLGTAEERYKQTMGQLNKAEDKLAAMTADWQNTETKRTEVEVELKSLRKNNQQLLEEIADLSTQLKSNTDQQATGKEELQEQMKLHKLLQEEASLAVSEKTKLSSMLEVANSNTQAVEEKLTQVQQKEQQLEVKLESERSKWSAMENMYKEQLEQLKEALSEKTHQNDLKETALSDANSKLKLISSTLDREVQSRKDMEDKMATLQSQLDKAATESQELKMAELKKENQTLQELEELKREKFGLEKDLANLSDDKEKLASKLEETKKKIVSSSQLVTEKDDHVSSLQQQLAQLKHTLLVTQETLRKERDENDGLQSQLATVCDQLATLKSKEEELQHELSMMKEKDAEHETSSVLVEKQMTDLSESVKVETARIQDELREVTDELMAAREQLAVSEINGAHLDENLTELQTEYAKVVEELDVTQKKLKRSEDIRIKIEKEKKSRGRQLKELAAEQTAGNKKTEELRSLLNHLKTLLASAQESLAAAQSERMEINEKKAVVEKELSSSKSQLNELQQELEKKKEEHQKLLSKLEQTSKSHTSLQEVVAKLHGDMAEMEKKLDDETIQHEQSELTLSEVKELWENEKKALQQLTEKLMEVEASSRDADTRVDKEKQKATKALRKAEKEFESLHKKIDKLQNENDDLSSQLTASRRQLRELEENDPNDDLRQELEHQRSSLSGEIRKLKKQINKENKMRLAAEQEATTAKRDVSSLKNKMSFKDKAIEDQEKKFSETEEAYHQLQKEMDELKEHVEKCTVPLSDLETYKETVDQKNREEMSQKLSELNAFMEQQAARQHEIDNMKAMHAIEESTQKDKELSTLKAQLDQALTELEKAKHDQELIASQSSQFKELYEEEQRKKEKLADELEKAVRTTDKIIEERNKSRKLYPGWMLNPSTRHRSLSLGASSPFRQSEQTAEEVVQSIRSKLDSSISKHMDSVDKNKGREEDPVAESHLDSICRQYKV